MAMRPLDQEAPFSFVAIGDVFAAQASRRQRLSAACKA